MLDIQYIANHLAQATNKLTQRQLPAAADVLAKLIAINEKRKKAQTSSDSRAATLNKRSEEVATCIKQGNTKEANCLKATISKLKSIQKKEIAAVNALKKHLKKKLAALPNLPMDEVPVGKNAADNVVVDTWNSPHKPVNNLKPHWELLEEYGLIDFSGGSKITGTGFPVYRGKGAKLQRALIQFFLDEANKRGYEEHSVPLLVNAQTAFGTGQLPDKEGMMYTLKEEELYLIPTAEVPLTNLYGNHVWEAKSLPIKVVGYTPCFRREAGSWGRHVRGLNRLHQFDKVEIVQIVKPEEAATSFQAMRKHVRELLEQLGLTYRVLQLCTGDLGFTSANTYDMEVWSPGQQQWLEVSSISCFGSYQARRMGLRYKSTNKNHYCYTLNGSALALPRVLATLLEHYQDEIGIHIPDVLQSYTGFSRI